MENEPFDIMLQGMKIFQNATEPIIPPAGVSRIYHYTSPRGLDGIVSSGSHGRIWASDIKCMSDRSELCYSYELIKDYIYSIEDRLHPKVKEFVVRTCKRFIKNRLDADDYVQHSEEYYLISVSFDRDNLNLWRCYTKNQDCVGYNIGLDMDALLRHLNTHGIPVFSSGRVLYRREEQLSVLERMIEPLNAMYETRGLENASNAEMIRRFLHDMLMVAGVFFKHPAFYDEKEYRIVIRLVRRSGEHEDAAVARVAPRRVLIGRSFVKHAALEALMLRRGERGHLRNKSQPEVHFREHRGFLIPYLEIPIEREAVKSIGISPAQRPDLGRYSVVRLLAARGYPFESIEVFSSSVPYMP